MKTFFVALLFFALGAGVFYSYNEYQKLKVENQQLKQQISPAPVTPTETVPTTVETSAAPAKEETTNSKNGAASGKLGYPSEGIPALVVYALNTKNKTKYYFTETSQNESTFSIEDIAPGEYYFVAYMKSNPDSAGGYTNAVPCGLLFTCKDHDLIPVNIEAGKKATHIEIKDWYADSGTFPAKPN